MNEPSILLALDARGVLRQAGIIVLAALLWAVLVIVTSLIVKSPRRGKAVLNQLRFLFFPALIFYVLVRNFWPSAPAEAGAPPSPSTALRVAETILAAAGVVLGMGILNIVLTPVNLKRWLGRDVPALLLDVVRYLIIVIAVAVILKIVWGEDVAPLIGALGIGGIVLGLALQEPLGNFFNGLAMLAERPFGIGDWIQVGDGRPGRVEHITWRAVKIQTTDDDYIIYPNSVISKERVANFSLPTTVHAHRVSIGTSYDDPPDLVKRTILEVLADSPGVLAEPRPVIYTIAYADFSINYEVKFFLDDFGAHRRIEDGVMTRLWYAFRRKGIEIPFPIRHIYHHGAEGDGAPAAGAAPVSAEAAAPPPVRFPHRRKVDIERTLAGVPIFADLGPDEIRALGRSASVLEYAAGERVIRQGEEGKTLYAIAGGTARVTIRGDDGVERDVATLKSGNVFGEMSLLTGDRRTASVTSGGDLVVVEVGKEALAPLLSANGGLADRIAEMVVLRKEGLDRAKAEAALDAARKKDIETATKTLLGRIRSFFGI